MLLKKQEKTIKYEKLSSNKWKLGLDAWSKRRRNNAFMKLYFEVKLFEFE